MKANQLVGRLAHRTNCAKYAHGEISRSFMADPIKIVKATDTHIWYFWTGFMKRIGKDDKESRPSVLSFEYNDNNWIPFDPPDFILPVALRNEEVFEWLYFDGGLKTSPVFNR